VNLDRERLERRLERVVAYQASGLKARVWGLRPTGSNCANCRAGARIPIDGARGSMVSNRRHRRGSMG
jgi:hypothetical protein